MPTGAVDGERAAAKADEMGADESGADGAAARPVSARSRRGLDAFVFFLADIQTGFGPFVAVFLATQKWTQTDIGLVLTTGAIVGLLGQAPAGALVDRVRSLKLVAAASIVAIGVCAFALAAFPVFPVVMVSRVLHAAASSVLGFALVTMTLGLVGPNALGERLGRNAAFASAGSAVAAAVMGACGYYLSNRAVFFFAAALVAPALYALSRIRAEEVAPPPAPARSAMIGADVMALARNRPLVLFGGCVALFHLANAAMLPLAATTLTARSSQSATVMVAGAIVAPQLLVTVLSPFVGRAAQVWGRRLPLILGFAALFVRGFLFTVATEPFALVLVQMLDGVSGAVLGVLAPLVVADLTQRSGRFNLAQGLVGCAMGLGAALSTTLAGAVADEFGAQASFTMLAGLAAAALAAVVLAMPETAPDRRSS